MRPRTRLSLCVLLVAAGLLAIAFPPGSRSPAAQRPSTNDAVTALLKERVAALAKIHDLTL